MEYEYLAEHADDALAQTEKSQGIQADLTFRKDRFKESSGNSFYWEFGVVRRRNLCSLEIKQCPRYGSQQEKLYYCQNINQEIGQP